MLKKLFGQKEKPLSLEEQLKQNAEQYMEDMKQLIQDFPIDFYNEDGETFFNFRSISTYGEFPYRELENDENERILNYTITNDDKAESSVYYEVKFSNIKNVEMEVINKSVTLELELKKSVFDEERITDIDDVFISYKTDDEDELNRVIEVVTKITGYINQKIGAKKQSAAKTDKRSVTVQLNELKQLLYSRTITQEQYDTMKAKITGK